MAAFLFFLFLVGILFSIGASIIVIGAAFEYDLLPLPDEAHTYREDTETHD